MTSPANDLLTNLRDAESSNMEDLEIIKVQPDFLPSDVHMLAAQMAASSHPRAVAWIEDLRRYAPDLMRNPRNFHAVELGPTLRLHTQEDTPRGAKSLVILICGNSDLFMMPLAIILQQFDERRFDVLRIVKPPGREPYLDRPSRAKTPYFRPGNVERDIRAQAEAVWNVLDLGTYRHVICAGSSSGGLAAHLTGALLRSEVTISLAAGLPPELSEELGAMRLLLDAVPVRKNVISSEHMRDQESARQLGKLTGTTIIPVPGAERHNVLLEIFDQGAASAFFERHFSPRSIPFFSGYRQRNRRRTTQ